MYLEMISRYKDSLSHTQLSSVIKTFYKGKYGFYNKRVSCSPKLLLFLYVFMYEHCEIFGRVSFFNY